MENYHIHPDDVDKIPAKLLKLRGHYHAVEKELATIQGANNG